MVDPLNCQQVILSEEVMDFIVEYNEDFGAFEGKYLENCVERLERRYAILHVDGIATPDELFENYGYGYIPKCYALLDTLSMQESGIITVQKQPALNLLGAGTVIGIVDTGIDYQHDEFKYEDNTTKIIGLWDQTLTGTPPAGFLYGAEFNEEDLNKALANKNPLEIVPSVDEIGHGTFMAGISAGRGVQPEQFIGAAPDAELIVVKLKQAKQYLKDFFLVNPDVPAYQSTDIMQGVRYVYNKARAQKKPCVLLLGLGDNLGAHDGESILSKQVSSLTNEIGRTAVIAAGNEVNKSHHFYGTVTGVEEYTNVEIRVGANETGFLTELWASAPSVFSIGFMSPAGEYIEPIPARFGQQEKLSFRLEGATIYIYYDLIETQTGDELIAIRFQKPTEGIWSIRVYSNSVTAESFHIWLPVSGFIRDTTFFLKADPDTTVTLPGDGNVPITAGAYNHMNGSIFINSSRGYTRTNQIKPDLVAPGVNVYGPLPGNTYGNRTGTSISAAHVAGAAALLLQWGIVQGNVPNMDAVQVKKGLMRGAVRNNNVIYPNKVWGFGILDLYNTFTTIL